MAWGSWAHVFLKLRLWVDVFTFQTTHRLQWVQTGIFNYLCGLFPINKILRKKKLSASLFTAGISPILWYSSRVTGTNSLAVVETRNYDKWAQTMVRWRHSLWGQEKGHRDDAGRGRSGPWLTCRHTSAHHPRFAVTPQQGCWPHQSCLPWMWEQPFQPPVLLPALPPELHNSLTQVASLSRPAAMYLSKTPNQCQGSSFCTIMHVHVFSQTFFQHGNMAQTKPQADMISHVNLM